MAKFFRAAAGVCGVQFGDAAAGDPFTLRLKSKGTPTPEDSSLLVLFHKLAEGCRVSSLKRV